MRLMLNRAHSLFEIKSVDAEQRVIEGFASTPELDRQGDSMNPSGAKFKLPLALLWQHQSDKPIGKVLSAEVTAKGIRIRAKIEASVLPFIEEAWQLIKVGLVTGLSIDWRPLAPPIFKSGVARYDEWEWLALSAVTIPANQSATIRLVKSLDRELLAASGKAAPVIPRPGVSGYSKDTTMTVSEQVAAARLELQTKSTRFEELNIASENEGGLDDAEKTEFATLEKEVPALTAKVGRLSTIEAAQAAQAKGLSFPPVDRTSNDGKTGRVEVKSASHSLPKGALFTRIAMAVAAGRGSLSDTIEYAKRFSNTPEVLKFVKEGLYQKAEAGSAVVQSPGWGGELVNPNTILTEYVELLRAESIIGRVTGFRKVPFNIPIITQTGGSTFEWVGGGGVKPVGELAFESSTLAYSKVAGIIVLQEELVRLARPDAEQTVRQDMIDGARTFLDEQFIRVAISAGANNPASITNGVSAPNATGTTAAALRHDLNIALKVFTDAGVSTRGIVIVMTSALARGIALLTTTLGVPEFPSMTPEGGTLIGYQVIVSDSVDSGTIVLFQPREIFLADDGRVTLDASREATLDMAGGNTPTFNLWQRNCVAIRAEQWIRWQKRRAEGAVAVIDTAAYAPA